MIGRLPNRSDKTPSKGEKKNCISAKTTANRALHFAASVIWPPRKSRISLGSTGIIKPIARMSSVTVTRIKMTAAGRDFIRLKHERNVVAAVVSTAETEGRESIKVDRVESLTLASHPLQLQSRVIHPTHSILFLRDDAAFLSLAKN